MDNEWHEYKEYMHDITRCGKQLSKHDAGLLVDEIEKHGRKAHIIQLNGYDYRVFMN